MELGKFSSKAEVVYGKIAASVAIAIGLLHIANTAGIVTMSSINLRVIHLMAMMAVVFLSPKKNKDSLRINTILRLVLLMAVVACSLYALFVAWPAMIKTGGSTNLIDAIVGFIMVLVLLEACRRYLAPTLTVVAMVFLLYPFLCKYLPGILHGRSYTFTRVFTTMFASTNGLYGIPLGVSSTYIVMFCMFGAFLKHFGVSEFMFKFSSAVTRGLAGATAKTAVIFSLLIGMITGSPAGNVAITGSITIPLMKQRGYKSENAAAYESVASTGGPLMPPVMGSAAFLMAEITGIRYVQIMKAAVLPALLYFMSIMFVVHYECKRTNTDCVHIPSSEDQTVWQVIKEGWFYTTPIIAMVVLLVVGYSPLKSAFFSVVALILMYIIHTRRINKDLIVKILTAIQQGATDASSMAVACATSGIIVGILSMTGLGSRISTLIVRVSQGNLAIMLIMVMITAIVLGMGLPTSPSYLVLATVAAPALIEMGQPVLASHLFVFFFACISAITPPVALASYVAAGLADADLNKVGITAFRYGIVSFILPFMFITSPALLLNGVWHEVIRVVIMALFGVLCLGLANVGFFRMPLKMWERVVLFISGLMMIDVRLVTDIVGIACASSILMLSIKRKNAKEVSL